VTGNEFEHLGFSAVLPNLRPALEEFARREGLIYRTSDYLALPKAPSATPPYRLQAMLSSGIGMPEIGFPGLSEDG
jgi:hypothetical protein